MKGLFRQHRTARQDQIEIFRHLARRGGLRAARRFFAQSEATFQRLATLPNLGTAFDPSDPRYAGVRYCPVLRFKSYVIFYRPVPDGIEILRILHGSRDLEVLLTSVLDDETEDEDAPEAE